MDGNELLRRRIYKVLTLASIGMLASLLMSCQKATDDDTNLALLEWKGYEYPKYYPDYFAKYGKEPEYTFFAEVEDAMSRLRTGYPVDMVHLCPGQMDEVREAGLIQPLKTERIPRWSEISPELLGVEGVYADGEFWMVPWEWGYSVVAYNPEMVDVEDATFDIFVDPRFKGKTALNSQLTVSFLVAGIIGGWADPLDPTEEEMEAAPELFTRMLENARFMWTDSTQLEQAWAARDVGISYVFGSGSRRMKKEGLPIVIVEPLITWMCGLSITTMGVESEDQVYEYINAMLDPQSGVELFDEYGYGHGNSNAVNLIDPARVAGTGIDDPAGTFARGVFSKAIPPAKKAKLLQLWFEAQAGLD